MPKVDLELCGPERRPVLEALFQLYIHDFSEHWAGRAQGELEEDGRFAPYPHLDRYWTEPDRTAWLIRAEGRLAGFALLSGRSHSGLPTDHEVAEFFVVRKHRRAGVGRMAAERLMRERPGQWEIAVARANVGALRFWRGIADGLSTEVDERDLNDARWNGAILRFRVA